MLLSSDGVLSECTRSSMKMLNRSGESGEPCSTPRFRGKVGEVASFTNTVDCTPSKLRDDIRARM